MDVIGLTDKDIWEIATFIKKDEEDYEWDDTTMVEFSVKDMLALEQIRVRVLERQYGVRWVGVATIKGKSDESGYPYMYDHKRCRALKKHKIPGQRTEFARMAMAHCPLGHAEIQDPDLLQQIEEHL